MKGAAFRREKIEVAHEECSMCDKIAKIALNNFRETRSQKTRSTSDTHWAEVSPHDESTESSN